MLSKSKYIMIFCSFIIFFATYCFAQAEPLVEIKVSTESNTEIDLQFKTQNTSVNHFSLLFIPPQGCKIKEIVNIPGEVTYKEKWAKINDKYQRQYSIDIYNYGGISSEKYRSLAKIVFDKYNLKGKCSFAFENIATRNDKYQFDSEDIIFYNNPYVIDYQNGEPKQLINYDFTCNPAELKLIKNQDSCFVVLDFYIDMYNTKEELLSLKFDLILPDGAELVRAVALKPNGSADPFRSIEFEKFSNTGYKVSFASNQVEWPLQANSEKEDGRSIIKLSTHIYDFCIDAISDFTIENAISYDGMMAKNNATEEMQITLSYDDFYANNFRKGDVSGYCFGDGYINNGDIKLLESYLAQLSQFDCYQIWAADLNDDGVVNKADLNILKGSTGIADDTNNNQVQIYPNPAANILNINSSDDITGLTIFNSNGMQVLKTNTSPIDISILPTGSYFLLINSADQKSTLPFVIQR